MATGIQLFSAGGAGSISYTCPAGLSFTGRVIASAYDDPLDNKGDISFGINGDTMYISRQSPPEIPIFLASGQSVSISGFNGVSVVLTGIEE